MTTISTPASELPYQIKRTLLGAKIVLYHCPGCATALKSKLSEAGSTDRCPACKRSFVVPGTRSVAALAQVEAATQAERQEARRNLTITATGRTKSATLKTCRFCAKTSRATDCYCRFCGSELGA